MVDRPDEVTVQPIGNGDGIALRARTIGLAIAMAHGMRFALDIVQQPR